MAGNSTQRSIPTGRGPGRGRQMGPKPKLDNPGKLLFRILKEVAANYAVHMIIVLVCIIVSVLASVRGTLFLKELITDYIEPMAKEKIKTGKVPDFDPLISAMMPVIIFYACGVVAAFVQNRIMIYVTQGTMRNIRKKMFTHMEELPIRYFDTHSHGDIMSMYTNDIDTLRQLISQSLPQFINSSITIVSVLISMMYLSITLTVVTLIMVAVILFASGKSAQMSGKHFVGQQKDIGKVNGYIEEIMTGQKVVKVFCHEDIAIKEFNEINDSLCDSAYNANKYANILGPINAQLGNVSYVICAFVGSLLIICKLSNIGVGGLISFLTFNRNFSMPINQVTMQMNAIVMALAGADRIFKLIDEQKEVDNGYVTLVNVKNDNGKIIETSENTGEWMWKHFHKQENTTEYKLVKGEVVFDDVDFGYDPEKIVLHNVKIDAKKGQKIAFVGSTGAGKTTITNLINRFYDIQDGKIRYDGININKIKKDDLRHSLGIVLQETHLFTGTVADNIRYGKLDATDDEVIKAAKLANADGFIRRLPEGYNTMLTGDGANLSQGQRQLLAIARAAIANPPVLILDEATSSIDTRTERLVQDGMDKLMNGRTTFVIAHRLSTVKNSDCIMVLEQGRIIERGTHDELLEKKGKYYQLYTGNSISA